MSRDDVIRWAREAGFGPAAGWSECVGPFERFAALVAAETIKQASPPVIVLNTEGLDLGALRASFKAAPSMPIVAVPAPAPDIAAAVAAEREACAQLCDRLAAEVDKYPSECAAAIRARADQ